MSIHVNSRISRRRLLGGVAMVSLAPLSKGISADNGTETWAFLSDTHIDKNPDFVSRNETNLTENLRKVVAEVMENRTALNGIIIDGDCAFNVGLKGDYENLARILQPLVEAGIPIHMTMGNHDDRGPFYETFAEMQPDNPPVESKHVGLVESTHVNFIFLDSLRYVNKVEGEFGATQLAWLAKTLDSFPDKPAILVGHHYPQVFRVDVIPSPRPIRISGLVDSDDFLELIKKRKQVKAYIFGHSHNWTVKTDKKTGFHQVNLPPTAYVFNTERPNGWVMATISPASMKLELSALQKKHTEHGEVKMLKF